MAKKGKEEIQVDIQILLSLKSAFKSMTGSEYVSK